MSETAGRARYEDPRAHALHARYLATFGGAAIPVPVAAIAEDLLGLRIEESWDLGDCSGLLVPAVPIFGSKEFRGPCKVASVAEDDGAFPI